MQARPALAVLVWAHLWLAPTCAAAFGLQPRHGGRGGRSGRPPRPPGSWDSWEAAGEGPHRRGGPQELLGWYLALLSSAPIRTKAVSTGCIECLGDMIAQTAEARRTGLPFDRVRSFACFVDGLLVTGPSLHYGYALLERVIPSVGGPVWATLIQITVDELIFDPIDIATFFCTTSLIERKDLVQRLRNDYWSTFWGGFGVSFACTPIQFISFRYMPVKTRVLVVNLCDLAWTSVVSVLSHAQDRRDTIHPERVESHP
uniref:Peroxisomal membrane protein MPV17 n=1 Tax=Rhizochromulina marina TaxID=1034831 RepID=A0A6U1B1H0_9STRA|mmetsp:Transcript_27561/g.80479  ORF Transcript_27561/g.80479 Transcript_27561/m.80479 type:complete len:258 (+) Transcript_27561:104-877(+)